MAEEHPNNSSSEHHDPLERRDEVRGRLPGNRAVRIQRHRDFSAVGDGMVRARPGVGESRGLGARIQRMLFGNPVETAAEGEQRVGVGRGLAIFSSDNISSSAYATEEIMRVLVLAGAATLALTMPITIAIIAVLAIVVISDRIVIQTYPDGGGSYRVAQMNLGPVPGLLAAAALLTDYTLTVAVSVSAGVAAITSIWPALSGLKVPMALSVVVFMTLMNLRGLRESGGLFAIPVYAYLVGILALVAVGLFRVATGTMPEYNAPVEWLDAHAAEPLALLLLLRAFASGSVALTGAEAVSNGTPSFQKPEVRNAQTTLVIMGALFATIFGGLSFLSSQLHIIPDPHETETVVSQLARSLVGDWRLFDIPLFYYLVQFSTAFLLVIAGNTAFNAFPRLASLLAIDQYLPRQFSFRGDRLGFTAGILVLAIGGGLLVYAYQASVTSLIPLYTVGVFVAFTLSQAGLIRRFWGMRTQPGVLPRMAIVGVGCTATGVVSVIVAVSKFMLGAWMVLLAFPLLVLMMWAIHRHYQRMSHQTEPETPIDATQIKVRAVVPVANLELPARQAIAYAEAIAGAENAVTLHIADESTEESEFRAEYREMGYEVPLVIIDSPYRSLIGPLLAYIRALRETHPTDTVTVVLPEYVPNHWWERLLHNQTAWRIRAALLFGADMSGVVVVTIPYHAR